nr:hypothetical protein B0A51_06296 [Rachicladosporium sp. CCFEE 5018]
MMAAQDAASEYIRQVLHHTEPPPPIQARFFYAAGGILIDDPLSPLPPPASGSMPSKQPPKPFSVYDNTALDKAWHELRRKILEYREEHGEKGETHGQRRDSREARDGKRTSGSRPSTPRAKAGAVATSSLSQYDGHLEPEHESEQLDGPSSLVLEVGQEPTTTGTPFIRAPSRKKLRTLDPESRQASKSRASRPKPHTHDTYQWDDPSHLAEHSPVRQEHIQEKGPTDQIAVGVSRLHQVEMPDLQMCPIYWQPVNDIAKVVRGTWFYQDTMLPVETPVANMLEAGYVELQVWTQTWKDELSSAVEVGALGEMKVVHMLWPEKVTAKSKAAARARRDSSRPSTANRENLLRTVVTNLAEAVPETEEDQRELAVEAACDLIDISSGAGGNDNKALGGNIWGRQGTIRNYDDHGVIYANAKEARILKPTLLPSAYYGRRPLANYIRKGHKLGIPVVRGFDQAAWHKLHPSPEKTDMQKKAEAGTSTSASGAPSPARRKTDPNLALSERPQVTDLILVIHGIGQKLSERMESYHFTHAINAFRRELNVEVGGKECKSRFRKGMGGIMCLPVNWRGSLTFEEGGYRDEHDPAYNDFNLNDITPDTLPSVRGIVSDVMLDIPYYMSHHQPKMIAAVIREANRVYKLWCLNNPGFSQDGRVHLIAHSLGSVIAIDILSKQPTHIPSHLSDPTQVDLSATPPLDHLLFNTHNLITAGSPAGFFLLLRKAQLLPRIDSTSSAALQDPTALSETICGHQGQYGCIAVENVYNIINGYDPVAYRVNAAVDASYSASLRKAFVPNASSSWLSYLSGSTKPSSAQPMAPPLPRLPSQVELEIHDFTREEIAEKRMLLLNDNGQIDFFVRYGGGPLEIQYLTMLGAHSSYWYIKDFVRFLVVETGREAGRAGTVEGMRAVKSKAALGHIDSFLSEEFTFRAAQSARRDAQGHSARIPRPPVISARCKLRGNQLRGKSEYWFGTKRTEQKAGKRAIALPKTQADATAAAATTTSADVGTDTTIDDGTGGEASNDDLAANFDLPDVTYNAPLDHELLEDVLGLTPAEQSTKRTHAEMLWTDETDVEAGLEVGQHGLIDLQDRLTDINNDLDIDADLYASNMTDTILQAQ